MSAEKLVALLLLGGVAHADPIPEPTHARFFFGLGISPIGGRAADGRHVIEREIALVAGQPVARTLTIVEILESALVSVSDEEPRVVRDYGALLVGVRWTPFRSRRMAAPRFYLAPFVDGAAIGFSALGGVESRSVDIQQRTSEDFAPTAGLAISFMPAQGEDYAFGLEVRGRVARYDDDNEYSYTFQAVVHLMK